MQSSDTGYDTQSFGHWVAMILLILLALGVFMQWAAEQRAGVATPDAAVAASPVQPDVADVPDVTTVAQVTQSASTLESLTNSLAMGDAIQVRFNDGMTIPAQVHQENGVLVIRDLMGNIVDLQTVEAVVAADGTVIAPNAPTAPQPVL
jgi:hypothetical protein